jgi:oxygen-independent coproporphyrinogen-3 oxidase
VGRGELPIARGVALTADDRFRGEIIERLMCDFAIDLDAVCARHGRARADLAASLRRLAPFVADGLVETDGGRIRAVGEGRLVIRSICAAFDAYFEADAGRHSKAI